MLFSRSLVITQRGLSGSVLGVGDFNLTPWSPHFQDLLSRGDLRDSSLGRGIQNTWYKFPTLLCGLPLTTF